MRTTKPGTSRSLWQAMQGIPRYYIYFLLAGVIAWQILFPIHFPIVSGRASEGVYRAIQEVPANKIVIISADWEASSQPETGPQTRAVAEACLKFKKPFAIMNITSPMGVKLSHDIVQNVAKKYNAEYGRDWINWGFKVGFGNVLMSLVKDIPKTIGTDFTGKPVMSYPIMRSIRTANDIGLVVEVTGLSAVTEAWIGLVQGPKKVPMAAGYTAVMVPGYYPFMDSGQLKGILVGAKGSAEMEKMLNDPDKGTAIITVQSWAHLLIMVLIVLGNIGYLLARRQERRA